MPRSRRDTACVRPPGGPRIAVELVAWWVLLFLLYVVFISTLSALELCVGAGVSGLAAVGAWTVHRAAQPTAGPAGQLAAALRGRPTRGRFRPVRLREGVGPSWACALLSGTPGSCVVAMDEEKGDGAVLTVHTLFPARSRLERALTQADDA
ncbi:multisubunit Na+/H+ antiporter MnhE subunit [Streptacidiphilus sp. MAP12-16]|uniref:hypothetical protein n=1 Tax=Streptacidiphilus sp. MAP12-16 TaxID=3156300 RepID=UPI0035195488